MLDHGQACDPYPPEYDPEWHRFLVFRTDASLKGLELASTVPVGGRADIPSRGGRWFWALDIDGDTHVDVAVRTYEGLAIHLGRGDGSFAPPVFRSTRVRAFGQFDDDAAVEILIDDSDDPDDPDAHRGLVAADAFPAEAEESVMYNSPFVIVRGTVDANSDGLLDIVIEEKSEDPSGGVVDVPSVLLSQP